MDRHALLQQVRSLLRNVFGERLCGVVLYGSEARGDAHDDSDIDFLVLLKGPIDVGRDIDAITRATYPLMLEIDRIIDATPVNVRDYEEGLAPLYRNAMKEGILA